MVNSITEDQVVHIFNVNKQKGIKLGDKRHPILQLERWPAEECIRGVAGGKPVPLIGAVVIRLTMPEAGRNTGPDIKVRFKITASGFTDWVGMIIGAKTIDHPSRGGLGHQPCGNGHWMEGF